MRKTGYEEKQYREQSEPYILFLAGIHNLVFVDVSIDGMPLRTLILLLADFLCITVYIYKREMELPRWRECSTFEKMMAVMLVISAVTLAFWAVSESDHFWTGVDAVALMLVYPCISGRKRFPQDIFCVYSACSSVVCILLVVYYLTGGICEPLIALLLEDHAVVPWLVLGITVNIMAYCFQEKGQIWYGINIVLAAFLLALQKNVYGMALAALVPLMLPIFCRPSKELVGRAAQAGLMYAFLVCNMSLITGYTALVEGIVAYDLEISVYMELMLAAMGVWFFGYWDRYAQGMDKGATVPEMRIWCRKAVTACLVGTAGIFAVVKLSEAGEDASWKRVAQIIAEDIGESSEWSSGVFGQMGQRFGIWGIAAACVLFYIGITRIRNTKQWRVKAHKLYRLVAAVCLMQALFLPQTMASLPVYAVFLFLFMQTEEERRQETVSDDREHKREHSEIQDDTQDVAAETDQEKGENADEADYSDPMLQRGGDAGDCAE